jgi:hypothetical protein
MNAVEKVPNYLERFIKDWGSLNFLANCPRPLFKKRQKKEKHPPSLPKCQLRIL